LLAQGTQDGTPVPPMYNDTSWGRPSITPPTGVNKHQSIRVCSTGMTPSDTQFHPLFSITSRETARILTLTHHWPVLILGTFKNSFQAVGNIIALILLSYDLLLTSTCQDQHILSQSSIRPYSTNLTSTNKWSRHLYIMYMELFWWYYAIQPLYSYAHLSTYLVSLHQNNQCSTLLFVPDLLVCLVPKAC
jgi:hypothetical protein